MTTAQILNFMTWLEYFLEGVIDQVYCCKLKEIAKHSLAIGHFIKLLKRVVFNSGKHVGKLFIFV